MPGEFVEKRINGPESELIAYVCTKCGAEVLWFSPCSGKAAAEDQTCSKCFLETVIFKEESK